MPFFLYQRLKTKLQDTKDFNTNVCIIIFHKEFFFQLLQTAIP